MLLLLSVGLVPAVGVCPTGGCRTERAVRRPLEVRTLVAVFVARSAFCRLRPADLGSVRQLPGEAVAAGLEQRIESRWAALLARAEETVCHYYPLGLIDRVMYTLESTFADSMMYCNRMYLFFNTYLK